ncbi:hypothetical protein B0J18DRAFT_426009 [Chaetomium sp. MPI-SDFR-AT-0129]|nr:hypothetical protein B0J18DRAFT_426009 [Chaetomium sp. MPI-SDFR-AT-0129]
MQQHRRRTAARLFCLLVLENQMIHSLQAESLAALTLSPVARHGSPGLARVLANKREKKWKFPECCSWSLGSRPRGLFDKES